MKAQSLLLTVATVAGLTVVPAAPAHAYTAEVTRIYRPIANVGVTSAHTAAYPASPYRDVLSVGSLPDDTEGAAYLKFDISTLPPGVITSATLRVSHTVTPDCGGYGEGESVEVARVTGPWSGAPLHWGNRPGLAAENAQTVASPCGVPAGGATVTTSLTPELRVTAVHPYDHWIYVGFEVEHDPSAPEQGTGPIWSGYDEMDVPSGEQGRVTVPEGVLHDGWKIRWRAKAEQQGLVSEWTDWQEVTVDVE
ncbi:DNRLRE domain-containing protein [Herbidospora cretacea]|uniref:DNRLRE domain-containing protein n=1 Tax=Herbidospora cretacea TaxID=28444 RepID=UPI000773CCAA|nr:DNRLRE domain-containing protein [Herbidospora cretacea]